MARKEGSIREILGLPVNVNLGRHRTYRIWKSMKERCRNLNHHAAARYSSRGITVCDRWLSFINFLQDMGHPPTGKHCLDRIDNDKWYSKENCRWATHKENNRNRSNHVVINTHKGPMPLSQAAELHGMPTIVLWSRAVKYKWPEDRWFSPVRQRSKPNITKRKLK